MLFITCSHEQSAPDLQPQHPEESQVSRIIAGITLMIILISIIIVEKASFLYYIIPILLLFYINDFVITYVSDENKPIVFTCTLLIPLIMIILLIYFNRYLVISGALSCYLSLEIRLTIENIKIKYYKNKNDADKELILLQNELILLRNYYKNIENREKLFNDTHLLTIVTYEYSGEFIILICLPIFIIFAILSRIFEIDTHVVPAITIILFSAILLIQIIRHMLNKPCYDAYKILKLYILFKYNSFQKPKQEQDHIISEFYKDTDKIKELTEIIDDIQVFMSKITCIFYLLSICILIIITLLSNNRGNTKIFDHTQQNNITIPNNNI